MENTTEIQDNILKDQEQSELNLNQTIKTLKEKLNQAEKTIDELEEDMVTIKDVSYDLIADIKELFDEELLNINVPLFMFNLGKYLAIFQSKIGLY